jgi:hypothetical protein
MARVDFLNDVNAREGTVTSARVTEYEGGEEFCAGAGACQHQKNILSTTPGYDSMTGIGSPGNELVTALANR